ncbi:squalene/phytoene synthase family protein [uncultured Sphingomonas sp.]|uniref:squalene/phytoene synthase family protein n=1 Tax=uncultured Sphingomonas sp. TaxID=158754 RepID=UPI0025DD1A77|nr:squalene/phytoene synthase family protein [uncultured Sphingomonas sp.]
MDELEDPEVSLAIMYAPADARTALRLLFAVDQRFRSIVASTNEPMIGMMRLAWWRESLEKLDRATPPAEPLLGAVSRELLPRGLSGATLSAIEDGWAALIDGEVDAGALLRHGEQRGGTLFQVAGILLGQADARLTDAGAIWALADLGHHHADPAVREAARRRARELASSLPGGSWPRRLRPLGMLTMLAQADADTAVRRQGHPRRLLRGLALRLTGR